MTDFSVPQRMSSGAFYILLLKYLSKFSGFFFISIIAVFTASEDDGGETMKTVGIAIAVFVALAVIIACANYFQFKFHVKNGNLIFSRSILSKDNTTIPLSRVHSLRTSKGILYRLLDIRGIIIDTLAVKGEEVELILSESDWQSLLKLIEQGEREKPEAPDIPPVYDPSASMKFGNRDLLLDSLCQNHLRGMAVLSGIIVLFFDSLSNLSGDMINILAGFLEARLDTFAMSVAGIVIFIAAIYLISLVAWIANVMLRYYNMSLTYNNKLLTFNYGMLERNSSRFPYDKICTLWVKRNYLEKRLGLCSLILRQALNASSEKEEDKLKIYGRDRSSFFISWWLGREYLSEDDIMTAKSGKGVFAFAFLPPLLISVAATIVLCCFGYYCWIFLPVAFLLLSIPKGILTMRHSHITLKDSYLIIGNGHFAEIKNYLKYDNVEVVKLTRSPLSKLTGRVSLSLSTSGTTFTVRSLREPEARDIYELILAKATY